jgi:hypothetical protein
MFDQMDLINDDIYEGTINSEVEIYRWARTHFYLNELTDILEHEILGVKFPTTTIEAGASLASAEDGHAVSHIRASIAKARELWKGAEELCDFSNGWLDLPTPEMDDMRNAEWAMCRRLIATIQHYRSYQPGRHLRLV